MGMENRRSMAMEIAEQIGATVLVELCDRFISPGLKCNWPLMMKPEQGMPFCWACVTDRETAHRGRTTLTKAKLAVRGFIVEDYYPINQALVTSQPANEDDESNWPEGMAL